MHDDGGRFMERALQLAEKGRLRVSPNPMVGAVLVKAGRIIGEGFHHTFGGPHAEIEALRDAVERGESPAGATLYVTLEPCCHQGKTPPCTAAIMAAGVPEVVCAAADPNPLVAGRGLQALAAAGISCRTGLREAAARSLNEKYFTWMATGRPFVMVKIAASLDGRVSSGRGLRTFITGDQSLRYVHRLRSEYEAIMVGAGTVQTDDPRLTCRLEGGGPHAERGRHPARIVVSSRAGLSPDYHVFDDTGSVRRIVLAGEPDDAAVSRLEARGVKIVRAGLKDGRVDMERGLRELGRIGISSVLVEAGPTLAGTLFRKKLVHRACFCLAPVLLGGGSALPAISGVSFGLPDDPAVPCLADLTVVRLGNDVALEGSVAQNNVRVEKLCLPE